MNKVEVTQKGLTCRGQMEFSFSEGEVVKTLTNASTGDTYVRISKPSEVFVPGKDDKLVETVLSPVNFQTDQVVCKYSSTLEEPLFYQEKKLDRSFKETFAAGSEIYYFNIEDRRKPNSTEIPHLKDGSLWVKLSLL